MTRTRTARAVAYLVLAAILGVAVLPGAARAQDPSGDNPPGTDASPQIPPSISGAKKIKLNGNYKIRDLVEYFARVLDHNYVLEGGDRSLNEEVSIISNQSVSPRVAEQAFVAALEVSGYTIVDVNGMKEIVKTSDASQNPVLVGKGDKLPAYDSRYVTQIIPLDNIQVSEVNTVVSSLASGDAKVIAYQPANTLIVTDTVPNLRKIQAILAQLDVSAPKSRLEVIQLQYAQASDVAQLIEQLYGVGQESDNTPDTRASVRRRSRRRPIRPQPDQTESVTAGKESSYISKIMPDERTNSLIVLANDQGFRAIRALLEDIDVDVDMSSRSQIHVVYLQNAKAEDVAGVLANLSEGGSRGSRTSTTNRRTPARPTTPTPIRRGTNASSADKTDNNSEQGNIIAAFDSGMRITHDESTNSLVIIASPEDFAVVKQVIDQLDVRRKQVFVDAVLLEIGSNDTTDLGIGYHGPLQTGGNAVGFWGGQLGASSLGLTQDLLTGLAVGVFGQSIDVPFSSGSGTSTISVPAFGIVLSALTSNSLVSIVSNPNLLTLDNQEAKIIVGRQIPFPTSSGLNSLGQPVISYQRQDVATELDITPRINSSDEVTLDVTAQVSEVEQDNQGLNVNQAGFITSKREIDTSALVRNNQTMVLGGLVGMTDTEAETKVPVLGDLPLIGALFRGTHKESRRTNLMVFLTPHIISSPEDMLEVQRIKEAQRQEFMRRFYGRSREQQMKEIHDLLSYSMNVVDKPTMYRSSATSGDDIDIDGKPMSDDTRSAIQSSLGGYDANPGKGAGTLKDDGSTPDIAIPIDQVPEDATDEDASQPAPAPAPADSTDGGQ